MIKSKCYFNRTKNKAKQQQHYNIKMMSKWLQNNYQKSFFNHFRFILILFWHYRDLFCLGDIILILYYDIRIWTYRSFSHIGIQQHFFNTILAFNSAAKFSRLIHFTKVVFPLSRCFRSFLKNKLIRWKYAYVVLYLSILSRK